MNKIPREFYKLFASKYMDYYQQFLTAIYEESGRSFSLLGLTEGECRAVDVYKRQQHWDRTFIRRSHSQMDIIIIWMC